MISKLFIQNKALKWEVKKKSKSVNQKPRSSASAVKVDSSSSSNSSCRCSWCKPTTSRLYSTAFHGWDRVRPVTWRGVIMQSLRQRERIRSMWRSLGGVGQCHRLISRTRRGEDGLFFRIIQPRWIKPTHILLLAFLNNLFYHSIAQVQPGKWSKTATILATRGRVKPAALSRVRQRAALRKGSAPSACGVTAGELALGTVFFFV